jgi:CO/xanthine dehydrogenase FAD-binding subunit
MKAAPFEYVRPASIDAACAALAERGAEAKLIAGGQSLVPMMAMRLARPALLVDINHLSTLQQWSVADGELRTGACLRQNVIERDARLLAHVPLLGKAIRWVGHAQTRNRGTVGGSIAHADPSAELPMAVCMLDAKLVLRSARGERLVSGPAFFTGPMMTVLAADECLTEVRWPIWSGGRLGAAFEELAIRHGDFAIVAVGAQVTLNAEGVCTRATIGVGGANPTPVAYPNVAARLVGTTLDDAVIADAAAAIAQQIEPSSDLHASAEYRRHLAQVLVARTLRAARDEALRLP